MMRRGFGRFVVGAAGVAALMLAGCQTTGPRSEGAAAEPALVSGYTCCNLHHEGDWINDGNYAQHPMIPAGTPIRITSYGRYRAHADIDGKKFRLGLDYGREAETTEQWVAKLVVKEDPKLRLNAWSPAVREAVKRGQVKAGMTKEQVIMSLGYPLTNENPRLDASIWRYWRSSFGEYQLHWNNGRISKVTGDPGTVAVMVAD
jgi:hypothetical protein